MPELKGFSIEYDSTESDLGATTVQDAIDNLRVNTINKKELSAGVDLDDIFDDGFYTFSSSALNSPLIDTSGTQYKYGTLIVISNFRYMTTQYCILNNKTKDNIYYRQYDRNNSAWTAWGLIQTGGGGGSGSGTVTNVAISNSGGLSVSGSPITSTGTISIGHANSCIPQQTSQGLYPITFDSYGHITSYGSAISIPTFQSVYNSAITFYKDTSSIVSFTANANSDISLKFTTTSVNSANVISKTFVDSITWDAGTLPTRQSRAVIIGGSITSIPTITAKTVVSSVTFNNVITGGTTTSIYTPAAKSVITSATGASASYSNGVLYITNGSFTTGNSIDFASEAINVYTNLTSGAAGSAETGDSINVDTSNTTTIYTSLITDSIYEITGVGTLPSLTYTTSNINSYVTTTSVIVLSNVS